MTTDIIRIEDPVVQKGDIEKAASLINKGGLVVIPTETVYGLGGDATNPLSSQKIYAAKGRPSDNPLIIHIAEPSDAEKYAYTNSLYYKLADAFMPGPLTVILKKKDIIPYQTTGGLDTVAVRCPSHPIAHAVIEAAGVAIAAPSANISGKPSSTALEHVVEDFSGRVDMIIDGGSCEIGLESTIVLINENSSSLTLLRPGAVTYDALCCVCDNVMISPTLEGVLKADEHPISPGMKYRHYAPSAEFVLLDGEDDAVLKFMIEEQKKRRCALLCYDEEIEYLDKSGILLPLGKKYDVAMHSKALFAGLRKCDTLSPDVIYAHLPKKDGLGLALYNRMIRAASHTVLKIDNNDFMKGSK
jgi:L-threonylcarbamoyladenylate synthase